MKFGLDAVTMKRLVGESRTDTVLGEAVGLDAKFAEHAEDGRWHIAVALQFNNHHIIHKAEIVGHDIMEAEVRVDGKPLSLTFIHQCDAVKAVLQLLLQALWIILQIRTQELIVTDKLFVLSTEENIVLWMKRVETIDGHTLLLGSPMIILCLYFKEVKA